MSETGAERTDGAGGPTPSTASLRAALENERVNADHLRRTARSQKAQLRRPLVRAALRVDRAGVAVVRGTGRRWRRLRRRVDAALVLAAAAPVRRDLGRRRAELDAALTAAAAGGRSAGRGERGRDDVVVIVVPDRAGVPAPPGLDGLEVVVADPTDGDPVAAAAAAASRARRSVLCFLAASSRPTEPAWLDHLVASLGDDVAAATPMLVHPERPLRGWTPHDLRVREVGLEVELSTGGAPHLVAPDAGAVPDPDRPVHPVDLASGACLAIDRDAFADVGGLGPGPDLDLAVIDLCARLRASGAQVVAVPAAVVLDDRPVPSLRSLRTPVPPSDPGWHDLLHRRGAALRSLATGRDPHDHLLIALTVAAPSMRVAGEWGDWHLGQALARSLRREGHAVHLQTLDQTDRPRSRSCDVHLVLRGLAPVPRSPGQRHVLWIISHPESVDIAECDEADLVLVASEQFAANLRERTSTPVEVLLQATDHRRFGPRRPDPRHAHDVAVVATTRHEFRPAVAFALAAGLRPAIYGTGWQEFVDPELVIAEFVPNDELPVVYSSIGVLLGDHWDTMRAWGFVSNRVFDALACGTPLVSDELPELDALFGDTIWTYHDTASLADAVGVALDDPVAARERAAGGRRLVLDRHTFDHRAGELLEALARHGLVAGAS